MSAFNNLHRHSRARPIIYIGILALLAAALLYTFDPGSEMLAPKCIFRVVTGFDCPGCGFQRAMHALFHGRWAEAVSYNYFLVLALPYLLLVLLTDFVLRGRRRERFLHIFAGRVAASVYIAAFLVWGVVRNVWGL